MQIHPGGCFGRCYDRRSWHSRCVFSLNKEKERTRSEIDVQIRLEFGKDLRSSVTDRFYVGKESSTAQHSQQNVSLERFFGDDNAGLPGALSSPARGLKGMLCETCTWLARAAIGALFFFAEDDGCCPLLSRQRIHGLYHTIHTILL